MAGSVVRARVVTLRGENEGVQGGRRRRREEEEKRNAGTGNGQRYFP